MTPTTITLREMSTPADAAAFRALNEEWIARWFRLEEKDIATLSNPQQNIIAGGGRVYVAVENECVVGTAALVRYADGRFELSKMAIQPEQRGRGLGRMLIRYVLEQAGTLGAHTVFLASNSVLNNAVHLYESVGFQHVSPSELPPMKYERADVFMMLEI